MNAGDESDVEAREAEADWEREQAAYARVLAGDSSDDEDDHLVDVPHLPANGDYVLTYPTFQEAAKARGLVRANNEAELSMQEAITAGDERLHLIRLYVSLCTMMHNRDPFALLQKFGHVMEDGQRTEERRAMYGALGDAGEVGREPNERFGAYNRLLASLDREFRRRGTSNAEQGLPAPMAPAPGEEHDDVREYQALFNRPGGDGYEAAMQCLRDDLPRMQAYPEQQAFFWQMWCRLRSADGRPQPQWDERWGALQLGQGCEPPAALVDPVRSLIPARAHCHTAVLTFTAHDMPQCT